MPICTIYYAFAIMSNCPWGASVFIFFNRKLLPSSNCVLRPHLLLGYQIQTEAHRSHNSFSCHMIQLSLYTILGTKEANQRRHVTRDSQSSDRLGGQLGSYLSQFFLQKSPWTSKKSTLSLASSLNQFCEKALNFFTESTCSPTSKVYRNLQRRP